MLYRSLTCVSRTVFISILRSVRVLIKSFIPDIPSLCYNVSSIQVLTTELNRRVDAINLTTYSAYSPQLNVAAVTER